MSEVTQPNELIETIEKALEAATQGKWVDCSWDPMERPHVFAKELQTGHYCNGKADLPQTPADCHLIANAPEWLRALLEENKRLIGEIDRQHDEFYNEVRIGLQELEQVKAELRSRPTQDAYNAACKALWKHRADNESLRTELSAIKQIAQNALIGSLDDAHEALTKIVGDSHE